MDLPAGPFTVIYADPPWTYSRTGVSGNCESLYDGTMDYDAIAALPVRDVAADDAYLFMWATWPKMWEGPERNPFRIMEAWGFRYVTCAFVWVKLKGGRPFFGIGHYMKSNSEFCLLGVRGNPAKHSDSIGQILEAPPSAPLYEVRAPLTTHSEKPDLVRSKIVEFCGDVPRLEMFSRHPQGHRGFTMWGNEVGKLVPPACDCCAHLRQQMDLFEGVSA